MSSAGATSNKTADGVCRYHPLVVVLLAMAGGILVDRFYPLPIGVWLGLATICLMLWLAARIGDSKRAEAIRAEGGALPEIVMALVLLASVGALAGGWHHCCWYLFPSNDLGLFARRKPQPVCIEGIAVTGPRRLPPPMEDPMAMRRRGLASRFIVDVHAVRDGSQWRPAAGLAMLFVQGEAPAIAAGDRIRCVGTLAAPDRPQNPGSFDHGAYLRAEGVLSRIYVENPKCVSCLQRGSFFNLARMLDTVRNHSNALLEQNLDPRCARLAEMVLLGEREQIEDDRIEPFMTTGTIHLLVISGSHLVIVAGGMLWLFRRLLGRRRGAMYLLVAVATVFYTLLVDAGPPVVRATVFVLIVCLAEYLGRARFTFNSLAAGAIVVLILNPNHLFHVGAQLSFLSVAGLMWWMPRWQRRQDVLERLIERNLPGPQRWLWKAGRSLRAMVMLSGILWLLSAPLVLARFHLFTLISPLVNAVVWLPVACGLLSGYVLVTIGSLLPPLAPLLGWFCNMNLWLLEACVSLADRVPGGHFWLPGPADWWLWGFYGGLGVLAACPKLRLRRRWFLVLVAAWIGVGLGAARWPGTSEKLDCTFLSMGHGCAVVLEMPDGRAVLYDAGRFGSSSVGGRTVAEFLWSRGRMRIDRIVLSHPDLDHFNAVLELVDKFSIGEVDVSPSMFDGGGPAVRLLRETLNRQGIPIRLVAAGDRWELGKGAAIEVLHPAGDRTSTSDNAGSLVLLVEYLGRRVLLTGDLESPGTERLLATRPRRCEVMLAPHHGSRKSNSPQLAAWCQPRWVVFSGDGRWNIPAVEKTYRAVGAETFWTSERGAIAVRVDSSGVRVTPFHGDVFDCRR